MEHRYLVPFSLDLGTSHLSDNVSPLLSLISLKPIHMIRFMIPEGIGIQEYTSGGKKMGREGAFCI